MFELELSGTQRLLFSKKSGIQLNYKQYYTVKGMVRNFLTISIKYD